jgi:diguanylate cyclase (GGDEF)-like protein/PAS domain S-box-containing protein
MLLAGIVLCSGLFISGYFLVRETRLAETRFELTFAAEARQIAIILANRLNTYQGAMRGVQGFFRASGTISHPEFRRYVDSLQLPQLLPGVQAVAFVNLYTPAEAAAHQRAMQAGGYPDYRISPAGERERYAPITYIEPLENNRSAFGFDVLTNPVASLAMEQALERDAVTISSQLVLIQDAAAQNAWSFVMYLPVYRTGTPIATLAERQAALVGWVDVPFRMNDLMDGLAGVLHPDLHLEIHDGEPGPASLMYSSAQTDFSSMHQVRHELSIGGRQWTLLMHSTPAFETAATTTGARVWLMGMAGLAISLLFSLLVWIIARGRHSAETRFAQVFAHAPNGILLFNGAHRCIDANPAALRMLGYQRDELLQLALPDILDQEHSPGIEQDLADIQAGKVLSADWVHRDRSGRKLALQVSAGKLSGDRYFTILHDMSQHHEAQQRIYRLTQLYKALSAANHLVLRRATSADLFPEVCQLAVEFGGMTLAWIGQVRESDQRIMPVASHGKGLCYVGNLVVSARADVPEGQGPTGTALRAGHPVIVNDYFASPATRPWHAQAREYGWNSIAAFPIARGGKPFAVLSVYHSHVDAFDEEAIALLAELASDISFALDNFDLAIEREQTRQALAQNEAQLTTILEHVGACIYLKDTAGRYLFANQQLLDLLGTTSTAIVGSGDEQFFDEKTVAQIRENDARVLQRGDIIKCEEINRVASTGETASYWSVKLPLRRPDGSIYGLCGISTDISERKASEDRIAFLSNYDPLTSLPNRVLLQDRGQVALATAARDGAQVALLYIDLDRFKMINESLGVSAGDQVLIQFASRLSANLQPGQTLCRQSGDVYILLLPDSDAEAAAHAARTMLEITAQPFSMDEQRLVLTACVGIALYPDDAADFERLAQAADAALFRAKKAGPNSFQFFTRQMHEQAIEILQIESDLRQAIEHCQLVLHYQPQIAIDTRRVVGVEALVRWQHPSRGLVSPGSFIPIAEESGLIIDIGNWVMREAIRQTLAWQAEGLPVVPVAVNLSAVQFRQPDFLATIVSMLRDTELNPALLELELTEGIAMENSPYTTDLLEKLHGLGIALSIDDFGMGYSSLSYLKRYCVDTLKIDQSFVQGLGRDTGDEVIVHAIIGIARSLGFKTLAEGVETEAQLTFLQQGACDEVQGFLFSAPVTAAEFGVMLHSGIPVRTA